jgi:hypothetical protein
MAWQIRMTAICENEIVTLRADACLGMAESPGGGEVSDMEI